jgi:hypothetical protein
LFRKEVNRERRKLNKSPHQKLSIENPLTNLLASNTRMVLTTKRNNPSVIIVTGNVRNTRIGLMKVFRIARTTAKMIAVHKSFT